MWPRFELEWHLNTVFDLIPKLIFLEYKHFSTVWTKRRLKYVEIKQQLKEIRAERAKGTATASGESAEKLFSLLYKLQLICVRGGWIMSGWWYVFCCLVVELRRIPPGVQILNHMPEILHSSITWMPNGCFAFQMPNSQTYITGWGGN